MTRTRKIIEIDEEKCDGCGICVPACEEGAIRIIDGKAKLIADKLCDGLGNCLGHCPQDAIKIIERQAEDFDESAVELHLSNSRPAVHAGGGCPSAQSKRLERPSVPQMESHSTQSHLATWPVKLELLQPHAPFLDGGHLLLTADCAPVALASFNQRFLDGKVVAIACPKFGAGEMYLRKLTAMFRQSGLARATVVVMEVPCCGGLLRLAQLAQAESGAGIPVDQVVIGLDGSIKSRGPLPRISIAPKTPRTPYTQPDSNPVACPQSDDDLDGASCSSALSKINKLLAKLT